MQNNNRDLIIKNNLTTWKQMQAARNAPAAPPATKPAAPALRMKPRAKNVSRQIATGTNGGAPGTGISNGREERSVLCHERNAAEMKQFRAGLNPITGCPWTRAWLLGQ